MRLLLLGTALVVLAAPLTAQQQTSEIDPTAWGVVYDVPATRRVIERRDLPFATVGGRQLKLDLYAPPGAAKLRPAVVFINAVGDAPDDLVRRWAIYSSWPRLIAAHDMVGISMDAQQGEIQQSLRGLFDYLKSDGRRLGIDADRIGVYAASANVSGAHTYLSSSAVIPGIRAAAYYYGGIPPFPIRRDLPVLFVQAQGDAARMGAALGTLWQGVVDSALPWTLVYGRGMPHAFDALTDSDDARRLIQQTIGFWESHLKAMPKRTEPLAEGRTIVEAIYANDQARAVSLLGPWLKRHPADAVAQLQYARMLVDLRRLPEADSAYMVAYRLDSTSAGAAMGLGILRVNQRRWSEAEGLLLRTIALGRENSFIHGQLGWAQMHSGKNAEAVASFEKSIEMGMPSGRSTSGLAWYNLACGYARLARIDDAFRALNRAVDEGVRERQTFAGDEDLALLRDDPRWQQLLSRLPA